MFLTGCKDHNDWILEPRENLMKKKALHYLMWTGLSNRIRFVGAVCPHTPVYDAAAAPEGRPGGGSLIELVYAQPRFSRSM